MTYRQAKQLFISNWGAFGSNWGINGTLGQIHALLLISPEPLSQDDLMEELAISRGNANSNIRSLVDWGLAKRVLIPGDRKEYFVAEKDIQKVATQVLKERKKRELEPIVHLVEQLKNVEGDKKDKNIKEFTETIANIKIFSEQVNKLLDKAAKADEKWYSGIFFKLL